MCLTRKGFIPAHLILEKSMAYTSAGNSWGCDADGNCCAGCPPEQEEFYACADVRIVSGGSQPTTPSGEYSQWPWFATIKHHTDRRLAHDNG